MKSRNFFRVLLLIFPVLMGGGCATHALWNKTSLDAFNQPADEPHLQLFEWPPQSDLLAVYNEYSERSDAIRTRAYFVGQNQKRVEQRRRPRFVSIKRLHDLTPVPVCITTNSPPAFFALLATNHQSFTLYSGAHSVGSHELPVYNDGKARLARIALTPVAVAADLTIVGGVVGYWVLVGLAESGYSLP